MKSFYELKICSIQRYFVGVNSLNPSIPIEPCVLSLLITERSKLLDRHCAKTAPQQSSNWVSLVQCILQLHLQAQQYRHLFQYDLTCRGRWLVVGSLVMWIWLTEYLLNHIVSAHCNRRYSSLHHSYGRCSRLITQALSSLRTWLEPNCVWPKR